jgi:2-succinyl-5-enolpyruvyl-6-hydroxy-3-cyclohexene-1-carboxylate synthase
LTTGAAQARWADGIISGLEAAGVEDLVVSPGSRSTPLVLASERLRRYSVADERSAAFLGLGLARESQRPVALLCTSGTAPAHYLPALMEAKHSGITLVAISADRPTRLLGRGANQSTDQRRLFGRFADPSLDLGDPGADPAAVARDVAEAVAKGLANRAPVHLNARFDKPLEPPKSWQAERVACPPPPLPVPQPDPTAVAESAQLMAGARRGLIVCGPAGPDARLARESAHSLSRASGFPIWAEACSQMRFGALGTEQADGLGWLLARGSLELDLVVQVGAAPVQPIATNAPHIMVCTGGTPDPGDRARCFVRGPLATSLAALARACNGASDPIWAGQIGELNRRVWDVVAADDHGPTSEPRAVHAAVRAVPADAVLQLGNSLPVRLVDLYCRADDCRADVASQRGLSGIDGAVAQALGTACAGRPVVALLGDVTTQHDLASLTMASRVERPVVLVVIDNGGGRIFDGLPVADHPRGRRDLGEFFTTAPSVDLGAVAEAMGVTVVRPTGAPDLHRAVAAAATRPECTLVHMRVDPDSARASHHSIRAALGAD